MASFPTLVKEISIGPHTIHLMLKENMSLIKFNEQFFSHLWLLVQQIPELSDADYLREFAEVSNFLWKGIQFECVISIESYQKRYNEQIELEKKYPSDVFPYRLTDYKIFDVSVMHDPRLEEGNLLYFVYNTTTGLPYRVVCPFPYTSTSTLVHYQILPIKTEASL